jgi:flagellar biogenesis protein FliO
MPQVESQENGEDMGNLIVLIVFVGVGVWLYKSGKRVGSRKGYNVGLSRGRSRRR